MTGQQAMLPDPSDSRIWPRFIEDGGIAHGQWMKACAEGAFVGQCTCGDYLTPRRPEQVGKRTDYTAVCRSSSCDKEVCAPGGRLRSRTRGA